MTSWLDYGWVKRNKLKENHRLPKVFYHEWIEPGFVFAQALGAYTKTRLLDYFDIFEAGKDVLVGRMYRQRGKHASSFIHAGMIGLVIWGVTLGPQTLQEVENNSALASELSIDLGNSVGGYGTGGAVLGMSVGITPVTVESDKPRAETLDHTVQSGETLAAIAEKYGVSVDTIRWANSEVTSKDSIKPGQILKVPPVTGIVHKVKSGETIYSISKKYDADAQSIVDYPFNVFTNDETFALAIGQDLVIPSGVMPKETPWAPGASLARRMTPDAGAVSATGNWIWPAAGTLTQPYLPWHKGIDIANHGGGSILAADAGKVIVTGWPDNYGYGNRVVVDHGNGYQTLYAHLSKIAVSVGQSVKRGDVLGSMGSTGRSTGTHLHFEIRASGKGQNPLEYLK